MFFRLFSIIGFPGGSHGQESACNVGDPVRSLVGKIPWKRKWQLTPVLLPRESHGWRSLADCIVHGVAKSRTRLSDFSETSLRGSNIVPWAIQ